MAKFTSEFKLTPVLSALCVYRFHKNALKLSEVVRMKNEPIEETEDEEPGGLWDEFDV